MKARLVAVGERPPGWVAEGFGEYRKRLSHWLPLELVEITPGLRGVAALAAPVLQPLRQRFRIPGPAASVQRDHVQLARQRRQHALALVEGRARGVAALAAQAGRHLHQLQRQGWVNASPTRVLGTGSRSSS